VLVRFCPDAVLRQLNLILTKLREDLRKNFGISLKFKPSMQVHDQTRIKFKGRFRLHAIFVHNYYCYNSSLYAIAEPRSRKLLFMDMILQDGTLFSLRIGKLESLRTTAGARIEQPSRAELARNG
jgi:hypothetical protein